MDDDQPLPPKVKQWRVTGRRRGQKPYLFVYNSDDDRWPGDLAEHAARRFVKLQRERCWSPPWVDGPHLHLRVSRLTGGVWLDPG